LKRYIYGVSIGFDGEMTDQPAGKQRRREQSLRGMSRMGAKTPDVVL
jgi:hypothetical protein